VSGRSPSGSPEIEVCDLAKRFGAFCAVDGVSFAVRRGETYGLLGPNGAGKTSIMRILAGLSPPSGGSARVAGLDVVRHSRAVRTEMGVVTQADGLDTELSARQNLEVFGYLAGLSRRRARERAGEVLEFFGLAERAGDAVEALSGGLRRRLAIARALMTRPRVIVLDEPSTGLDPESRVRVWEELAVLKRSDVTILMSTHYMDEAETLCDRIAMLHSGRILDEATPPELVARHAHGGVAEIRLDGATPEVVRQALEGAGLAFREVGALFRVTGEGGRGPALPRLEGVRVTERTANLEDVFLVLAGQGLIDE
jgi:lipooligosaccharide transport system ATP-binding protein